MTILKRGVSDQRGLEELGEFGLIRRVAERVGKGAGVTLGIGDDAAAVAQGGGLVTLCTSDMLLEGIHFDLSLCDPMTLGRKSLSVNLSDIAAMGGEPRYFLLSLAIPRSCTVDFVDDFTNGLLACAAKYDVTLIGGDTCAAPDRLVISITLLGEQVPGKVVRRDGARKGDSIFVTGVVGDSALGLQLLRQGVRSGGAVMRHLDPSPRVREGKTLAAAELATAMIDVSDGLMADLGHILEKSAVGAEIHLDSLPISAQYQAGFRRAGEAFYALALTGGEDYELLFTTPPSRAGEVKELFRELGTPVTEIGTITAGSDLRLISADGNLLPMQERGYDHFAGVGV